MTNNQPISANKLQIGVLLISTGKYDVFVQPLIDSMETYFFPDDEVTIYLFWDKKDHQFRLPARFSIVCIPIEHKPWPYSTLLRYKYFTEAAHRINTEYLYYLDVDMQIVGRVDKEILSDITVTRHPGFYMNKEWGSPACHPNSTAYLRESERHKYFAGGFQGGTTDNFLQMSALLATNIEIDELKGIRAQHNDETHLNWFINGGMQVGIEVKELTPAYCSVPDPAARSKYQIEGLEQKIIALDKDHAQLRAEFNPKA